MVERKKCCGRMGFGENTRPCTAKVKVERDGNFYCNWHDPICRDARKIIRKKEKSAAWVVSHRDQALNLRRRQMYVEMASLVIVVAAGHPDARGFARRLVAEYQDVLNAKPEEK